MAAIMTNLELFATSAIKMAGSVLGTVTAEGNEMLLVYMMLPLVGLGVGFLGRLFHIAR